MDRGALWATVQRITGVGHDLATQQQQQKTYSWSRDSGSVLRAWGWGRRKLEAQG